MSTTRQSGFTILELLIVMAALVILGSVLVPTLASLTRDTNMKASGDLLRRGVAEARSHSVLTGVNHFLCLSPDGKQLRVMPDPIGMMNLITPDARPKFMQESFPKTVNVVLVPNPFAMNGQTEDGWLIVATFLPDGTCREDIVELQFSEPDTRPQYLRIRGVLGFAEVVNEPLGAEMMGGNPMMMGGF